MGPEAKILLLFEASVAVETNRKVNKSLNLADLSVFIF